MSENLKVHQSSPDLNEVLAPLLATLALDGYEGTYEQVDGTLLLQISAGEGVCEDCLSPKEIMTRIVARSLENAGLKLEVELRYPTDVEPRTGEHR